MLDTIFQSLTTFWQNLDATRMLMLLLGQPLAINTCCCCCWTPAPAAADSNIP